MYKSFIFIATERSHDETLQATAHIHKGLEFNLILVYYSLFIYIYKKRGFDA